MKRVEINTIENEQLSHKDVYNQYAISYNNAKSKLTALNELMGLSSGFLDQIKLIENQIETRLSTFDKMFSRLENDFDLGRLEFSDSYKKGEKNLVDLIEENGLQKDQVFKTENRGLKGNIESFINDVKHDNYFGKEVLGSGLKTHIQEFESMLKNYQFPVHSIKLINDLAGWALTCNKAQVHARVLDLVVRKIIDSNYEELTLYAELSEDDKEEISRVGNPDWIDKAYIMPKGFFDKAKIYTDKEKWDQYATYNQLIADFKDEWNGKKPSFTTVYRRLKKNNIW